jgi:hypothetical protein
MRGNTIERDVELTPDGFTALEMSAQWHLATL